VVGFGEGCIIVHGHSGRNHVDVGRRPARQRSMSPGRARADDAPKADSQGSIRPETVARDYNPGVRDIQVLSTHTEVRDCLVASRHRVM
jgi:hypothetical protein